MKEIILKGLGYIILIVTLLLIIFNTVMAIYTGKYYMLFVNFPFCAFINTFYVDKQMKLFGRY